MTTLLELLAAAMFVAPAIAAAILCLDRRMQERP